MIAAVAAAMIGGVYAEAVYDYSASLKTTTGKAKVNKTTYKIYLGHDGNGDSAEFWYQNAIITRPSVTIVGYEKDGITPKVKKDWKYGDIILGEAGDKYGNDVGCKAVKFDSDKLDAVGHPNFGKLNDAQKEYVAVQFGFDGQTTYYADDGKEYWLTDYPNMQWYKNKYVWCGDFSFKTSIGDCYRTATTVKAKGLFLTDDCCDFGTEWEGISAINEKNHSYRPGLEQIRVLMLNRFGSNQSASAKKVEFVGVLSESAGSFDPLSLVAGEYLIGAQGDVAKLGKDSFKNEIWGVKSLSGNIVGCRTAPTCENCCKLSDYAAYFTCNWDEKLTQYIDAAMILSDGPEYHPTAAFGTCTFKFNLKYTKAIGVDIK